LSLFILATGIVLAGFALVGSINAQQEEKGIGVSPLTFELTANPGDKIKNQVKVYNPSKSRIGVKMEVEDFTATGEIGHVIIAPSETDTYSLSRWVTVSPQEFNLDPGGQQYVNFTITVPDKAEPGGHYGSILARITMSAGEGGEFAGAAVAGRVGVLVLLTVSGDVKESLAVKSFSCPESSQYGPVPFEIRFENTGTVHVKPRGFITITNWLDKKVASIEFPVKNAIPGSVRKIEASWSEKWHLGKYTATLTGSYGTSNTPFNPVVITFWVIPWKEIIGITLISIFILTFFFLTRRRWSMALRIILKGK